MGVYLYTVRSKNTPIFIGGVQTPVHHFSYALKFHSSSRSQEPTIRNSYKHAENAFTNRKSNFVVMCDTERGLHDGDAIYSDLGKSYWEDCLAFPGKIAGFAKKIGRKWCMVDTTDYDWNSSGYTFSKEGVMIPMVTRSRVKKNVTTGELELVNEQQYCNHDTQQFVTREEAMVLGLARKNKQGGGQQ